MSEITKKLGARIRAFRKGTGMSQEELAFKSSISTTYLGQLERAEKSPTVDILERIAKALDISVYDLFLFDEEIHTTPKNNVINKINAHLSTLSENEQSEMLKLIKNVKAFKRL